MNNQIYEIIKKHHLHPVGYQKKGKVIYLKEKEHIYVIKLKTNNYDIYQYLLSHDFPYFPKNYSLQDDNYDLSEYIDNIKMNQEQRINELINILSLLHKKTLYKRKIDLDDIKKIYEDTSEQINNKMSFFLSLNDNIDNKLFLSPSEYLLVRNITTIYNLLNYANYLINKWYAQIQNKQSTFVSLLHNNVSLDHFLINGRKYLINWDKASFDFPIYDLINLYKKYYQYLELNDLFLIYEKNNSLDQDEKELLLIMLIIGVEISLDKTEIENIKAITNAVYFWEKIDSYINNIENKKEK